VAQLYPCCYPALLLPTSATLDTLQTALNCCCCCLSACLLPAQAVLCVALVATYLAGAEARPDFPGEWWAQGRQYNSPHLVVQYSVLVTICNYCIVWQSRVLASPAG
jgi:hypothetical protein